MKLQFALSQAVLSARQRMGYTQMQAAEAACISLRCYQRIESGQALPSTVTFLRLQESLNLDPRPLLNFID